MDPYAFQDKKIAAAHLLAAVVDLESMGARALEYRTSDPKWHKADSWHGRTDVFGSRHLAADMNHDGAGDVSERDWFRDHGLSIAKGHGLAICAGIYGYVPQHSVGDGMHMHLDVGVWTSLGNTGKWGVHMPWHGAPTLPAWPVRAFQKAHGLEADGIPGKLTISKLQQLVGAQVDGIAGKETWSKTQAKVGATVDGVAGGETFFKLGLAIEGGKL